MDQLAGLLRQRLADDYQLQKAAVNSILATFTASEGELAKSIAVRDEDREVCEHSDLQAALRFKMHVTGQADWAQPQLSAMVHTLVYVPGPGMVFVHEAMREGEAPTEGMPIPGRHELLPQRHSFEGWSRYSDEHLETYFKVESAERLQQLTVRVEAGDEFAVRKLVGMQDGKLTRVLDPETAKDFMTNATGMTA